MTRTTGTSMAPTSERDQAEQRAPFAESTRSAIAASSGCSLAKRRPELESLALGGAVRGRKSHSGGQRYAARRSADLQLILYALCGRYGLHELGHSVTLLDTLDPAAERHDATSDAQRERLRGLGTFRMERFVDVCADLLVGPESALCPDYGLSDRRPYR